MPAYRDEVAEAVREATFLHLWSELIARSGYDRSACPPAGSFLNEVFRRLGVIDRFARVYEAGEVEALMAEWIAAEERGSPRRRDAFRQLDRLRASSMTRAGRRGKSSRTQARPKSTAWSALAA